MLNFTVGPVQMNEDIRNIGAEQVPYFRTPEFSQIMMENEKWILEFAGAAKDSKAVFLTGSGTAAMEASIINTLTTHDKVLVINGGSFGQRFVEILTLYNIDFTEIKLNIGETLKKEQLEKYSFCNYTAFVVNLHETSTGVLYDINMIGDFCKKNHLFLIVDAISCFLADDINMVKQNIDILITGSQKALSCPPGISVIMLSNKAIKRINNCEKRCYYLDLKAALKNSERGQTPFTPAVGTLRQIHERLRQIKENGGVVTEINKVAGLATYFRNEIKDLPFEIVTERLSNAVTSIHPINSSAYDIFNILKDEYKIWVCPNGGELKDKIFRVGHIGDLTTSDFDTLISAFKDLQRRKLI